MIIGLSGKHFREVPVIRWVILNLAERVAGSWFEIMSTPELYGTKSNYQLIV